MRKRDLVDSLLESGESDLAEQQMDLLENPPEDQVFRLGLLRDSVSLAEVEERALRGLRESGNPVPLIDFAHALLSHSPALGILVARAVLSPESHLDSITLLDLVEEARDRLDLSPEDIGAEIFERLFDAKLDEAQERALDQGMADLAEETRKLRREQAQTAGERRELKRQLARYERQLQKTAKPDEQASDDAEAERLRLKVRELKGLVQEGNKKRQELRDEIKGLSLTPEPVKEQTDIAHGEDKSEYDHEADTWPLLLPVFTSKAEKSLRENPALGRRAITRIGELCSGSSSLRSQVKKMKARPDLRSIRVGRSHRLLVRPQTCEGRLEVVDFVNRRDLESALR